MPLWLAIPLSMHKYHLVVYLSELKQYMFYIYEYIYLCTHTIKYI